MTGNRTPVRVRIHALGGFRIVVDGRELRLRTRKDAMVLLRLAMAAEADVSRDDCIALLWPESTDARARHSLSEALRGIEQATGIAIARSPDRLRLEPGTVSIDVDDLRDAMRAGDVFACARLYVGGFLAGWYPPTPEASHWVDAQAATIARALEKTVRAELTSRRQATDSRGVTAAVAMLERLGAATDADREVAEEAEQITAWESLRPGEAIQPRIPLDREGPFVGRVEEMKLLTSELDRALAGELRVVLVSGEAGIGKTRTCQRLARLAALRGCRLFLSTCYELEQQTPYATVAQLFSTVVPSEVPTTKPLWRDALGNVLPALHGEAADSVPSARDAGPYAALMATTDLFNAIGKTRSLFLLIDDAHWADATSCQILHSLIKNGEPAAGGLIAISYRSTALRGNQAAHSLVSTGRAANAGSLVMAPLTSDMVRKQIRGLLRANDANVDELVEISQGNPFFARQLALAWTGNGIRKESVWDVLHTLVEGIPTDERALLECIAVSGTPLPIRHLSRVLDWSLPTTLIAARALLARGLLKEVGTSLATSHDLLRESIYQRIDAPSLAATHGTIAARLHGDQPSAFLAQHYAKGGLRSEARAMALEAARESSEKKAYKEEVDWLVLAVEMSDRGTVLDVLHALVPRLFALARYSQAAHLLQAHARQLDDRMNAMRQLASLKCHEPSSASYESLRDEASELHATLRRLDMDLEAVEALRERIRFAQDAGDLTTVFSSIRELDAFAENAKPVPAEYARAVSLMKLATFEPEAVRPRLNVARREGINGLPAQVLSALVTVDALDHYNQGRTHLAGRRLCEAVRHARQAGNLADEVRFRTLLVPVATETLRFARAERHAAFVLRYAQLADTTWERAITLANLALMNLEIGDYPSARALAEQAMSETGSERMPLFRATCWAAVGQAALLQKTYKDADRALAAVEQHLPPKTDWVTEMSVIGVFVSRMWRRAGRRAEASQFLREIAVRSRNRYQIAYWQTCLELARNNESLFERSPGDLTTEVMVEARNAGCRLVALRAQEVFSGSK